MIEANRTTLATQRATAQIAGQRLIATVGLVKALGGGWQASQPAPMPEMVADPAARLNGDLERPGFLARFKGLFQKRN